MLAYINDNDTYELLLRRLFIGNNHSTVSSMLEVFKGPPKPKYLGPDLQPRVGGSQAKIQMCHLDTSQVNYDRHTADIQPVRCCMLLVSFHMGLSRDKLAADRERSMTFLGVHPAKTQCFCAVTPQHVLLVWVLLGWHKVWFRSTLLNRSLIPSTHIYVAHLYFLEKRNLHICISAYAERLSGSLTHYSNLSP